jgi:DNA repair protein RadC
LKTTASNGIAQTAFFPSTAQEAPADEPLPVAESSAEPTAQEAPADEPLPVAESSAEPTAQEAPADEPLPAASSTDTPSLSLFTKAVLREAIDILPRLPQTESLDDIGRFLRENLHYSSEQTRRRYSSYINHRMFPHGYADAALRQFATRYSGRQELRDVCFYRFCIAEPLLTTIVEDVLLPAIGSGSLERSYLHAYLAERFPSSKSTRDATQAVVEALVAGGIVRSDRNKITFAYRPVLLPSFAFVLHNEFSDSGMYDLVDLEHNRSLRALLWNPDRLLSSLYELRNLGILVKISEIDSVRQFTTRWGLEQMVQELVQGTLAHVSFPSVRETPESLVEVGND